MMMEKGRSDFLGVLLPVLHLFGAFLHFSGQKTERRRATQTRFVQTSSFFFFLLTPRFTFHLSIESDKRPEVAH